MRNLRQKMLSSKGAPPIAAKGPQDCKPLTLEQFKGATIYVAKAFMSAALLPKEFFTGVPLTGSILSNEGTQRTLLATFAHFKDKNLTLNFFCRYKALLQFQATHDLSQWVISQPGIEYGIFNMDILALAARHPLLPSGEFESTSFISELKAMSTESVEATEEKPTEPIFNQTLYAQQRMVA